MTYRPLPSCVTIQNSDIEGLGVFATANISNNTRLGETHFILDHFGTIRTPLGGFINHSDDPNCKKVIEGDGPSYQIYSLYTIKDIMHGEELTLNYTFYKVSR